MQQPPTGAGGGYRKSSDEVWMGCMDVVEVYKNVMASTPIACITPSLSFPTLLSDSIHDVLVVSTWCLNFERSLKSKLSQFIK